MLVFHGAFQQVRLVALIAKLQLQMKLPLAQWVVSTTGKRSVAANTLSAAMKKPPVHIAKKHCHSSESVQGRQKIVT